jgi:hypothetical protein
MSWSIVDRRSSNHNLETRCLLKTVPLSLFLQPVVTVLHHYQVVYSIMSEQRKAVIKNADMEEKMQQDAVDIASKALSEYNIEKVC